MFSVWSGLSLGPPSRVACTLALTLGLVLAACAPAAPPSPAAAPPKTAAEQPAPTAAAAKPAPTQASAKPALEKPAATAEAKTAAAVPAYDEKAVADFYRGKTFRIVVGFSAGGGFDTIFRLWGRHASKHIPGNPNVIVENMPGAGGLIAANHVYSQAPKDGTTMGTMDLFTTVLGQVAGAKEGREFDASKFQWIGNPGDFSPTVCAIRSELGFKTFTDVAKSGKEVVFGASGKGNVFYATPRVLAEATGLKINVIDGYKGNPAVRAAVDQGELDGACWGWASMKTTGAQWFEGNPPPMRVIVQSGTQPYPGLENVELLRNHVKDLSLVKMVEVLENAVYHVYLAAFPPGVPVDRVAALRDAWLKGWNDPETKADLEKAKLQFAPVSGQETEKVVRELLATPSEEGKRIGKVFGLID